MNPIVEAQLKKIYESNLAKAHNTPVYFNTPSLECMLAGDFKIRISNDRLSIISEYMYEPVFKMTRATTPDTCYIDMANIAKELEKVHDKMVSEGKIFDQRIRNADPISWDQQKKINMDNKTAYELERLRQNI
jgi:hypothetical protein